MLLEPAGGQTVRNMHVNLAAVLGLVLTIALSSAALAWHFAPAQSEDIAARYYQLQNQNHALRDKLATHEGELAVANEQIDGLKHELLADQQKNEQLRLSQNIYESILEARKFGGVRILRASGRMDADNRLHYRVILVKGGNYPRSVSGSLRILAIGGNDQQQLLQLGKKAAELPYRMDSHVFLEGSLVWEQDWRPLKLHIIRLNYQGVERDHVDVNLEKNQ